MSRVGTASEDIILITCHTLLLGVLRGSPVPKGLAPKVFFSSCNSVLLGWDSGVWVALYLHLCLLQEGSSSQNLAAIREEGSLGCVLQR